MSVRNKDLQTNDKGKVQLIKIEKHKKVLKISK